MSTRIADAYARADALRSDIAAMDATMTADPDGPYTVGDRDPLVEAFSIAIVDAVSSPYAWEALDRGVLDIDDVDLDKTVPVLVAELRAAFSACGGHAERVESCEDCTAREDLREPVCGCGHVPHAALLCPGTGADLDPEYGIDPAEACVCTAYQPVDDGYAYVASVTGQPVDALRAASAAERQRRIAATR